MMGNDSARAFYGPAHVLAAHELGAVQTLLLTDTLLRVNDVALRRRYAKLVEEVGAGGGQAIVFSGAAARQLGTPWAEPLCQPPLWQPASGERHLHMWIVVLGY